MTKVEDVRVRVRTLVESRSVAEVHVEFAHGTDEAPTGSTASVLLTAVPVNVGWGTEGLKVVVRFHPTADELEMLFGAVGAVRREVAVPKVLFKVEPPFREVDADKPAEFVHGLAVEVALNQGAWLLTLLIGVPEMLVRVRVQGQPVQTVTRETWVAVTVEVSVAVMVVVTMSPGSV